MNSQRGHSRNLQPFSTALKAWPEFKILNTLIQRPNASVADAVQQICNLTRTAAASNKPGSLDLHTWHTFCSLIEVARSTAPVRQAKLIEWVVQLAKVTMMDEATDEPLRSEQFVIWKDLPALGFTAVDE
ncbi:MAG: hypothetical protein Q9160_004074 [Pyrenula sp. 1 TL-2023]